MWNAASAGGTRHTVPFWHFRLLRSIVHTNSMRYGYHEPPPPPPLLIAVVGRLGTYAYLCRNGDVHRVQRRTTSPMSNSARGRWRQVNKRRPTMASDIVRATAVTIGSERIDHLLFVSPLHIVCRPTTPIFDSCDLCETINRSQYYIANVLTSYSLEKR